MEEARGRLAKRPEAFFFLVLRALGVVLRHLQPGALRQKAHRIRITEVFDLHDEVDHAAALMAAEAIEDPLVRGDGEGRRLFAVEGAQTEQVAAAPRQRNILPHDVLDRIAVIQLVQKRR